MNRKMNRILILIAILGVVIGVIVLVVFELFLASFPGLIFGQLVLTRESRPLSPRAYQSTEFILDTLDLSGVDRAEYIKIQDDFLSCYPFYVGYPRTILTEEEIRHFQDVLSSGHLYDQDIDGNGFHCLTGIDDQKLELTPCLEGKEYQEQFLTSQLAARTNREVGVLQIYLEKGQLVEIRLYPSEGGLAFEPVEKGGEWWFRGVSPPSDRLIDISSRVEDQPIEVLWPNMSSARANQRGRRIIGKQYHLAREAVLSSRDIQAAFGQVQEIRPAAGVNTSSTWMDSSSVTLTFRVLGSQGEGVVIARGWDCFDLQMVLEGKPVESSLDYQCP